MAVFKANVSINYTVIPNETAQDLSISFEARGLLSLMLSLPSDWEIHKSWLVNQSPICGRDKLTRIMKELQEAGYIRKVIKQDEKGKMDGCDWLVYPKSSDENRTTENPSNGIPATTKETSLQSKNNNKDKPQKCESKVSYSKVKDIFNKYFCRGLDPVSKEVLCSSEIKMITTKRKKIIDSFFNQTNLDLEKFEYYIEYVATDKSWLYFRKVNTKNGVTYNQRPFEFYMSIDNYVKASEENTNK